ncbi:MAG: gamma-glutamyl-gamma-aminobutyrate hydrolase family protein [Pseudomonadota bacterium]
MTRPVIGVTTSNRSGWRIFPLVNFNLWLSGGRGLRWGAGASIDLDAVDGVIIGGGDDISPELYGGTLGVSARLDPNRDALERRVACAALERDIPVLGICRGAQMLNVALDGTLDQDAWGSYPTSAPIKTILPRRRVIPTPDSRLAQIVGAQDMSVNALHTQAVDQLGRGLRVSARDGGGMVQAIERIRAPFALGVQWHPEHLFYARRQRAIFTALVVAARAYRKGIDQLDRVDRVAA